MNPIVLIPARMASTRLDQKPLQDINGEPMILHVWKRAMEANVGDVVVACDNEEIAKVIQKNGGMAILTEPNLPSGSDRIWKALLALDQQGKYDVVINLQGDLPNIQPRLLQKVLRPLRDEKVDIATLGTPFASDEDRKDPNQVKIILSKQDDESTGRALYFSRSNAPFNAPIAYYHIGIYAYRRNALERFIHLPVSSLEKIEKLEQLRALEAGMRIDVEIVDDKPVGVDTPEDLDKVRQLLEKG